jgi:exopolysaccharide biosynthesis polyprenyl glycosylphosphotransferase
VWRNLVRLGLDLVAVSVGALVARSAAGSTFPVAVPEPWWIVAAVGLFIGARFLTGAYQRVWTESPRELVAIWKACAVALAGALAVAFILDAEMPDRWASAVAFTTGTITMALTVLERLTVRSLRRRGRMRCRLLLVAAGDDAASMIEMLAEHRECGIDLAGVAGPGPFDRAEMMIPSFSPSALMGTGSLTGAGRTSEPTDLDVDGILLLPASIGAATANACARAVRGSGGAVLVAGPVGGATASRLRPSTVAREPLWDYRDVRLGSVQRAVKRTIDLGLGMVLCLVALPIMGIVSVAILVRDGRPIFFRQVRVGRDGATFTMLKFRTMVPDAEHRVIDLRGANERSGPLFKLTDDPRVTRTGQFLRTTSLDELPQLINVVGGSMSLVGPRPALPSEVATFDDELLDRHRVKPGITGLWQVESRDSPSFGAYRRLDLHYVENWSIALDLELIVRTIGNVALRGARLLRRSNEVGAPIPIRAVAEPSGGSGGLGGHVPFHVEREESPCAS